MDPNAALEGIRTVIGRINTGPMDPEGMDDGELGEWWLDEALHLAELVEGLDRWLTTGGWLPRPWAEAREALGAGG